MEKNKKIEELKNRYKKIREKLNFEEISDDDYKNLLKDLDEIIKELFEEIIK